MDSRLEHLLALPNVWQASRPPRSRSALATGYAELDARLHEGGWPDSATTELLLAQPGLGELRLMLPALRQAQARRGWLAFIAPPHLPHAAALVQQGIRPEVLLLIKPTTTAELLWSAEQSLQSGCFAAVLTWVGNLKLNHQQLRRLQQAAHRGQCWHTLFRNPQSQHQASPSALRLHLQSTPRGLLQVDILKQRGGWGGQTLQLRLQPDLSELQRLEADQLPLPLAQFKRQLLPLPDAPPNTSQKTPVISLLRRGG